MSLSWVFGVGWEKMSSGNDKFFFLHYVSCIDPATILVNLKCAFGIGEFLVYGLYLQVQLFCTHAYNSDKYRRWNWKATAPLMAKAPFMNLSWTYLTNSTMVMFPLPY